MTFRPRSRTRRDVEADRDGVDEKRSMILTLQILRKLAEEASIIADKLSEVDSEHKETYQKMQCLYQKVKN